MDWWVTPGGAIVAVGVSAPRRAYGDTALFYDVRVESSSGASRTIEVRVDELQYVNMLRRHNKQPPLTDKELPREAWIAALRTVDAQPGFFDSPDPIRVELGYNELDESSRPARLQDHALRNYIVRRLYLAWKHDSFRAHLAFDERDTALTGAGADDFLRNLQLLEQEGYVEIDETHDKGFAGFTARGTALLVRSVERYASAAQDAESHDDYTARIKSIEALGPVHAAIIRERLRYQVAQTSDELASVFRATVPIVEGVVRRLLESHGSTRAHSNLGPMIQELTGRRIGSLALWSQLSAIQTFARDISLHGQDLPPAVLRISCETCFELFPQLGAAFPKLSA